MPKLAFARSYVVAFAPQERFPRLPALIQQALNATNSVAAETSELETASTIATYFSSGADYDAAINAAASSYPACHQYIATIGKYVRQFGGGADAPMINFLGLFAREFGASRILGAEYWNAVTDLSLPSATTTYPHLRCAMLAANLISPKVVDGVARHLMKGDVDSMKQKKLQPTVAQLETDLAHAWDVTIKLGGEGRLPFPHQEYGRFACRQVLHFMKKSKTGREKRTFKDVAEIRSLFVQSLRDAIPEGDLYTQWSEGKVENATPSAKKSPAAPQAPINFEQTSDPVFIAAQKGFELGSLVQKKDGDSVYRIDWIASDCVTMMEQTRRGDGQQRQVEVSSLASDWVLWSGKVPRQIVIEDCHHSTQANAHEIDLAKVAVFQELTALAATHQKVEKACVTFWTNPYSVLVNKDVKKGGLTLVPMTELSRVTTGTFTLGSNNNIVEIKTGGNSLTLESPTRVKFSFPEGGADDSRPVGTVTDHGRYVVAAYWWVMETGDEDEANMSETDRKAGAMHIPCYINNRALKNGEVLYKYVDRGQQKKKARI